MNSKTIVEFHIKNELQFVKIMFLLDTKDLDINIWYNNYPCWDR